MFLFVQLEPNLSVHAKDLAGCNFRVCKTSMFYSLLV